MMTIIQYDAHHSIATFATSTLRKLARALRSRTLQRLLALMQVYIRDYFKSPQEHL